MSFDDLKIDKPQGGASFTVDLSRVVPPIDYSFLGAPPQDSYYFFSYKIDLERFAQALARISTAMPEFSSTLLHDGTGGFLLGYVPGLLKLQVRESKEDYVGPADLDTLKRYVRSVVSAPGCPLCEVTVTECRNGSVAGFSLSHLIADGFMRRAFLEHLMGHLCATDDPPYFRHCRPARFFRNPRVPTRYDKSGRPFGSGETPVVKIVERTSTESHRFRLSTRRIAELRAGLPRGDQFTDGDIVTAQALRTCGPEMFKGATDFRARIPVDVRHCMGDSGFAISGNAFIDAILVADLAEWKMLPLAVATRLVHGTVQRLRDEVKTAAKDHIPEQSLTAQPWFIDLWSRAFEPFNDRSDIAVTNVMRLPVVLDFGYGPPVERFGIGSASNSIIIYRLNDEIVVDVLSSHPLRQPDDLAGTAQIDETWLSAIRIAQTRAIGRIQ